MSQNNMPEVKMFKDEWSGFSNFTPVVIYYEGLKYPSVEHAFVAAKTLNLDFRKKISELAPTKAGLAKSLGRKCLLRLDWDNIKVATMSYFLKQKFSYDKFKTLLLSTGDMKITEGNYWHDNFWGDCYCKKCENVPGENILGKLLMKIREDIQ